MGTIVVAVALGGLALVTMQPHVSGQFHDDGLYLSTAKSMADGLGYRHASLPTAPVQTKYPPLYSALLAGVWKIAPAFPASIPWFKVTSTFGLIAIVLLAGALGRRRLGGAVLPPVFAFLVGASPLVFPFADYALTELPFLALVLAALWLAPMRDDPATSLRKAVGLGVLCGLALLIRQAALPLVAAGLVCYAARREWRPLGAFLLPALALVLPWVWFKIAHAGVVTNPLLTYYVSYEPSVLELGLRDPGLALQILVANVYYLWGALDLIGYFVYFPATRVLLYPVIALGLWRLFRRPLDVIPVFAVLYSALILLWPWHPARYAVPLAPLLPLALLSGGKAVAERMTSLASPQRASFERAILKGIPWAPVALLVLMAGGWLAAYSPTPTGSTRAAFLVRLDYDWTGFDETARWVRENTATDAVLATAYDPLYYLQTGRRGVRPWFHRPWTYFYPRRDPRPDIGAPTEVQAALVDLDARYLIVDPLDGYEEMDAAYALYEGLLELYAGPEFAGPPRLRFVSSDSLHRVYELPRRNSPPAGAAARRAKDDETPANRIP